MILHKNPLFQICFGTAKESVSSLEREQLKSRQLRTFASLPTITKAMRITDTFFLHQTHSNIGVTVTEQNKADSFTHEGDFIITDLPELGIGVLTADCLPIVFYDAKCHVAGIAHAGWRGSIGGVGVQTVVAMQNQFDSQADDLQVFFGPSAKVCCYEVGEEVLQALEQFSFGDEVIVRHEHGVFFDVPKFNQLLLEDIGIKKEAFHVQYNVCTMCQGEFASARRQGAQSGRQATIVALK